MAFVHLDIHSEYSFSSSLLRIPSLIEACRKRGIVAAALTDTNNMCAAVKFYKEAIKHGIKPIIGCDIKVLSKNHLYPCTLLAKNRKGYEEISYILTKLYENKMHGAEQKDLCGMQDTIVLSGGIYGELGTAVMNTQAVDDIILAYQNMSKDFFITLHRIGLPQEEEYIQKVLAVSKQYKIPVVAVNNVQFLDQKEYADHEIRVGINEGYTICDGSRKSNYTPCQYLKEDQEMRELFADIPSSIDNALHIGKICNIHLATSGTVVFPKFSKEGYQSSEEILEATVQQGIQDRNLPKDPKYTERLTREFNLLKELGYIDYFLIIADLITWAKSQGIAVGPGRGSGASSLIAYCMHITDIDPITHDLLFERFLNKERKSLPDFDIDFCQIRRDEVIEYISNKYGTNKGY